MGAEYWHSKAKGKRGLSHAGGEALFHSRVHMILKGQDDGKRRRFKSTFGNGLNYFLKENRLNMNRREYTH